MSSASMWVLITLSSVMCCLLVNGASFKARTWPNSVTVLNLPPVPKASGGVLPNGPFHLTDDSFQPEYHPQQHLHGAMGDQRDYPFCLLQRVEVSGDASAAEEVVKHIGKETGIGSLTDSPAEGEGESEGTASRILSPGLFPFKHVLLHFISCVDPRAKYAVLGSPGGDIGEMALGLSALEKVLETELPTYQVQRFFEEFVGMMIANGRQQVYMHTDQAALDKWKEVAEVDPLDPPVYWDRQRVMENSVNPEHIGCQHLKGMVENEGDYQVRAEITKALIQSFYNAFLDAKHPLRSHLLLVVFKEEPATASEASIQVPEECYDVAPLIVPKYDDSSLVVNHKGPVKHFRKAMAKFFNFRSPNVNIETVFDKMNEIAEAQAEKVTTMYSEGNNFDVTFKSGIEDSPF